MAVKLNQNDLEFILNQIKIAEAHSAGVPLTDMIVQPHLPYGLRTVDGSYNNILPGRELWGAADQTMPRMFDPNWNNDADGDTMALGGGPTPPTVTNTDYNVLGQPSASNGGHTGNVADADPRIISNLIADQTPANPAAIIAALTHAGFEGSAAQLNAAVLEISTPYALIRSAEIANNRVDSWTNTIATLQGGIAAIDADNNGVADNPADAGKLAQLQGALMGANGALAPAQAAATAANAAAAGQQAILDAAAAEYGIEFEIDGKSLKLPNVAPDEGLSAPFNGWMTFFGQFFDHGLDLISKGGNGKVYVPLEPDDPLYVEGGFTNFMVLTRATPTPGPDGILGTADDEREQINTTTPFVDQNQTYTSHPSHQVFLREYANVGGQVLATGHLLEGQNGGLATWKDVKDQARDMLGIELTDRDVFNIPLVRTDLYGEFIRDPVTGYAQVIVGIGPDGIPNTADDVTISGTPADPVGLNPNLPGGVEPVRTSHAFLDDIAHNAVPVLDTQGQLQTDGNGIDVDPAGNAVQFDPLTGSNTEYDNELLDRHFITGDGRGNENIGLTAVHHVFHSEHNRQVEAQKIEILKSGDLAFINEWLLTDLPNVAGIPADGAALATFAAGLNWDGERLFQSARFATEMQYQHLVFEEFGRKIQPMIDLFVFNSITDFDPAIFSEFANVVYRFGHSMLTEEIARMFLDANGNPVVYNEDGVAAPAQAGLENWGNDIGLIEAFLNPIEYDLDGTISHEQAAGAIFRGMTLVHGNAIDEFVVDALRNNLLGLPLDLATINIARGRDTGMPTLNQAREQLYAATSSTFVQPYENWADFAANLKTPASIINFIAAYGTHAAILAAGDDVAARRDAATLLVLGDGGAPGDVTIGGVTYTDRIDFVTATGTWANQETGINLVDLWIGGLAEKFMPFGGMLGSTFNAVFEAQMEMLQDGDRFYYLTRTQGLNLLNELENNAFSKLIMANTDMTLPGPDGVRGTSDDVVNYYTGVDSFAKHDFVLHVDPTKQIGPDPEHDDAFLNALGLTKVQRDNLATIGPDENYIRILGGEHAVIGGTEGNDTIIADFGDDAIWGGGGDDRIEGGAGVDLILGGAGNDIITDSGDAGDFIKGEDGDDVIANSNGIDILMGGRGKDVFFVGVDATEVFAGEGDDFILGGADADFLLGNEGDDWIEGGDGFDVIAGDNSELFFNSTIIGHDVMFAGENENDFDAESGDDIMVQGESVMRNEGMLGFDWAINKDNDLPAESDLQVPIFTTVEADILRDRFDLVEALSGWKHDDVLRGDDRGTAAEVSAELDMTGHELNWAGLERIDGLGELLGLSRPSGADDNATAFTGGNILLGGAGSDLIEGRGANDFIDGDAWLNVRIRITAAGAENLPGNEIATVDTLKHVFSATDVTSDGAPIPSEWVGKALSQLLLDRVIVPNQMHIVREIVQETNTAFDLDIAVYNDNYENDDGTFNYTITPNDDGTITVTHVTVSNLNDPVTGRQIVSDGVDTLRNVEQLQFLDQTIDLRIVGGEGNDTLVGTAGADQMVGGPGDDTYVVNDAGDAVIEDVNAGTDTVLSSIANHTLAANVENLVLIAGASNGTGNGLDNRLTGNSANNVLSGGGGVDTVVLAGPVGSHTFALAGGNITVSSAAGGVDTLIDIEKVEIDGVSYNLVPGTAGADANVSGADGDELVLGFGGADSLFGNAGNDILNGGAGVDSMAGGAGNDIYIVDDATDFVNENPASIPDSGGIDTVYSSVSRNLAAVGQHAGSVENLTLTGNAGTNAIGNTLDNILIGNSAGNILLGDSGADTLDGGGGNDHLLAGPQNDILFGGAGDDIVDGGSGDDLLIWRSGDGRDFMNGGPGTDTVRIEGDASAETFVLYTAAEAGVAGLTLNNVNTEIAVTRNGAIIAELDNVEEIQIAGLGGGDTFAIEGDFTSTTLSYNTITIEGSDGDDTVDIRGLNSDHRVVFRSNGGNDTILGDLRPQDIVEMPDGATSAQNEDGSTTISSGESSDDSENDDSGAPAASGSFLDREDLRDLREMVRDGLIRDASGEGNNVANPTYGTAGQNFIRLTDAHYTDGATGIRETSLTPREISDIVSNQDNDGDGVEESIPNEFGGSALLTFFGQYFDHGLDFVAKGNPGSVAIGSSTFPINAPRSNIVDGTGVDPDGVPNTGDEIPAEYVNNASPFVDQNQAYGSHDAITDVLRKWVSGGDGQPQQTAYLLAGDTDATGRHLLPTFDHLRENFRIMSGGGELTAADISNYQGTGQPLLIDFIPAFITLPDQTEPVLDLDAIGHYFIAGDGRANENVMLTSIHTIWARNHNYWVDQIKEQTGGTWTEEEYFQAARTMNIAEYQQVVFTEFATAMAGGLGEGDEEHGFEEYDPTVDASISVEFAQAAYRFGHSMLNEDLGYVGADGSTTRMSLVEAFLRPDKVAELGIDGLLAGATADTHQAIDVDMVNALRNQLVGRPLDLAALNIFRGRDMGIAPFNEVRTQLYEQTGKSSLRPYEGWDDFQTRNDIPEDLIAKLKEAYPDGFETMDMWIGGLAEKPVAGQLGSTFGYIFLEQLDRLQHGDRFYYLEIFDDSIFRENTATFAKILERNTGLTDLPENVFMSASAPPPVDDDEDNEDEGEDDDDGVILPGDDDDDVDDDGEDDDDVEDNDDDDVDDDEDDEDDTDDTGSPAPTPGAPIVGTDGGDVRIGTANGELIFAMAGDDLVLAGAGNDTVYGGDGADHLEGEDGDDTIDAGAGDDVVLGGRGADQIYAGAGADRVFGGEGDDIIDAGTGNDTVYGGAGNDRFVVTAPETGTDGNDVYWGDDVAGGIGVDTLDMSAISANITANLGVNGGVGSASSAQTGNDALWNIENIITGSGNDVITAGSARNVMDGGAGDDIFRFLSAGDANGDTINGFMPGDRIDLSAIDADATQAGNQSFTLANGPLQLEIAHETRSDGDYTVVSGNVQGADAASFSISIKGTHTLDASDFV